MGNLKKYQVGGGRSFRSPDTEVDDILLSEMNWANPLIFLRFTAELFIFNLSRGKIGVFISCSIYTSVSVESFSWSPLFWSVNLTVTRPNQNLRPQLHSSLAKVANEKAKTTMMTKRHPCAANPDLKAGNLQEELWVQALRSWLFPTRPPLTTSVLRRKTHVMFLWIPMELFGMRCWTRQMLGRIIISII